MVLEQFKREYMAKHGITPCNIDRTFDNVDIEDERVARVVNQLKAYVENYAQTFMKGVGLLVIGPPGSGKTLFTQLVLREIYLKGLTFEVVNCDQLLMLNNSKWTKDNEGKQLEYVSKLLQPQILLIDNAPLTSHQSRSPVDNIHFIMRERYTRFQRPTIINAPLRKSEIIQTFGRDMMSFAAESTMLIAGLEGVEDYRKKIARSRRSLLGE